MTLGRTAEKIRRLRFGDLKKILRCRCRYELPDDDAGRDYLELLLDVVSLGPNARDRMLNQIEIWAPWMDSQEFCQLVDSVQRKPEYLRKIKADQLGQEINLTYDERQQLRIRTIAPADLTPAEFAERRRERRREKQRENQRKRRRKAGVKSRTVYLATSQTKLKPWAAFGISRSTWERRRERDASLKANKLLDSEVTDLRQSLDVESRSGNSRTEPDSEASE